ncbi:Na(+)-translocating NADH-quinone reductase subunit F [Polaribacter marinivivus]|uniref:Na(+)-translocating NADH-quinone reductase subunit F n=1 Tax=Polaribacter marinivivus TaxID=1524260 RepID=A0ABV8R588_9FLAO|nr:Na(+)-translocating NADH-quinone reductase subunit F [uncultured Polaribacter sp.]
MQILTAQELHNLAMNIVGEKLEKMGYEFQAINSQLKRHPQFVLFKKGEPTIFVLVKASNNLQNPNDDYDKIWMETFKQHAIKNNAKVWFAGVGIANAESVENPVFKDQPYYVAFEDFVKIIE